MAARTLTDIDADLTAVNTAITGILTGAQATGHSDGSRVQRADLDTLRLMKADLLREREALVYQTSHESAGALLLGEV